MNLLSNNRGISLIEVIIAAGLLSVIALGVARMMDMGFKGSANLTSRQETRELRDQFYISIKKNSCGFVPLGETLASKNLVLDVKKNSTVTLTSLYSPYGQEFKAGDKYDKLSLSTTAPFVIAPPSQNSPFVQAIGPAAKTSGGFYKMDTRFAAELKIMLTQSKAAGGKDMPLNFLVLLTLDANDKIIDCQSMAEVSAAKESCDGMETSDGKINFTWNEDTLHCDVTSNTNDSSSDGILNTDDPGDADQKLYVLSEIP